MTNSLLIIFHKCVMLERTAICFYGYQRNLTRRPKRKFQTWQTL